MLSTKLAGVVMALVVVLSGIHFELSISRVNESCYEWIRSGMAEAEITEKLGPPLQSFPVDWVCVERRQSNTSELRRADQIATGRCKVWVGENVVIFVFFDNNSVVVSAEMERAAITKKGRIRSLPDVLGMFR